MGNGQDRAGREVLIFKRLVEMHKVKLYILLVSNAIINDGEKNIHTKGRLRQLSNGSKVKYFRGNLILLQKPDILFFG